MTTKNFFEKEPVAMATIISRKNNISYEILLVSYIEHNKEMHQDLLFNFYNACHMTKSDNNHITFANKDIMTVYSGKEPCGIVTATDKENNPIYKMYLVSHAKKDSAIYKHQERFGIAHYIVSGITDLYDDTTNNNNNSCNPNRLQHCTPK